LLLCATISLSASAGAFAANKETIQTTSAYIGENGVRVDVYGRNEVGLLEYFNLIVFDDSRLEYSSIAADRGVLWYGAYPTQVVENKIYVHGVASAPDYCMPTDLGDPGSPLFHIIFNVKGTAAPGMADLVFSSEGAYDGHWNNCAGQQISPDPDYYDGGVNVLGHAGHVTISDESGAPGSQVVVDVHLHNDLDVFEYFNKMEFDNTMATVDYIVAARGVLQESGNYPTQVVGNTIYVHGWAGTGNCFYADHTYPGAVLYRIHFTLSPSAPPGYTIPLSYQTDEFLWDHWVGCDLTTTDTFDSTDGSLQIEQFAPAASTAALAAVIVLLGLTAVVLLGRHAKRSPVKSH
jgi:hypothetical protein